MSQPQHYSPYDGPLWESIAKDEMRLQRCEACGTFRYPPGPCCPKCLSLEYRWEIVGGRGRVLSWTTFHRQYLPSYPPPHSVVAVALEEGPIMIADVSREDAERLALDAEVRLTYVDHPEGYRRPQFKLC